MKKGDIIQDLAGNKYTAIRRLGKGGQAKVWQVKRDSDKKDFAYKSYKTDDFNVRSNIESLIAEGAITDQHGNELTSVVLPLYIVEGEGTGFGYIMELVDLKDYTTLPKAWNSHSVPNRMVICKIVQNMADFFVALHGTTGWCYKDINEGNIYFNVVTGDIKIIDNDNVGPSSKVSIRGTHGYMAPEVVLGDAPDERSDNFSFAVYIYRLLTYANPFYGKKVVDYCQKHEVLEEDAARTVYGADALYIWHPANRENSVEGNEQPGWNAQANLYRQLPNSVKKLFEKTFATNLSKERRAERTSDEEWRDEFASLEKTIMKCNRCGCLNFSGSSTCVGCDAPIHNDKKPQQRVVRVKILSKDEKVRETILYTANTRSDVIFGDAISKNMPHVPFFKLLASQTSNKVGIKNLSEMTWTVVLRSGKEVKCPFNTVQELEPGMILVFKYRLAQMRILDIK